MISGICGHIPTAVRRFDNSASSVSTFPAFGFLLFYLANGRKKSAGPDHFRADDCKPTERFGDRKTPPVIITGDNGQ